MKHTQVAKRYAKALYQLSKEHRAIDETLQNLLALNSVVGSPDGKRAMAYLTSRRVSTVDKKTFLNELMSHLKMSADVNHFMHYLLNVRRMDLLVDAIDEFDAIRHHDLGIEKATVSSCYDLDDETKKMIVTFIENETKKRVEPRYIKDTSLIGGVTVKVGSKVLDGSLKGQLSKLRKEMFEM